MKRAMELSTTKKVGGTTNPKKVRVLVEKYRTAFDKLSDNYRQLELIDTTRLKKKEMVALFTAKVLEALGNIKLNDVEFSGENVCGSLSQSL